MKSYRLFALCAVYLLAGMMLLSMAAEQSQNPQALKWFKTGLKEKNLNLKIKAYMKAVALDPLFVEALYNLGTAYKSLENYKLAKDFLQRAFNANPNKTSAATKTRILYELGIAHKETGESKEAVAVFHQAMDYVADSKFRIAILYELGWLQYKQKQYAEALSTLREGETLDRTKSAAFYELIQTVELAMQAEGHSVELDKLFADAERARQTGDLAKAKSLLEQIKVTRPGYRNVEAKIADVEAALQNNSEQIVLQVLYEQARKNEDQDNLQLAMTMYQSLLDKSKNFKDAEQRLTNIRQTLDKNRRQELLEIEYAAGMAALKKKDWVKALFAFDKVLEHDLYYLDARKRWREAQRGLNRKSDESVMSRYYAQGLLAMKKNNYRAAYTAFDNVRKINANYRNVASVFEKVASKLEEIKADENAKRKKAQIDSLLVLANDALQEKDWVQAVASLGILRSLVPEDEKVRRQLVQAQMNLKNYAFPRGETQETWGIENYLTVGGFVAALFILPMVGVMIFSQTVRARLF
ncbi:MAG: tetratricopeptide repeat protein, partial [bacterium]